MRVLKEQTLLHRTDPKCAPMQISNVQNACETVAVNVQGGEHKKNGYALCPICFPELSDE